MSILSLSHIDLDGIGCQIVLNNFIGQTTNLNCNYNAVDEYLITAENIMLRERVKQFFITDLSLTETQLKLIYELSTRHLDIEFIYIDHHHYEFNVLKYKNKNLKIFVSEKFCATKLLFLYLKQFYKTTNIHLELFSDIVDAYDMWRKDHELFKIGMVYNDLFWSYKLQGFYNRFRYETTLRTNDKENFKKLIDKKNKLFEKKQKQGAVFGTPNKGILLTFFDDFHNYITLDFKDYLSYINIATYGGVGVRFDKRLTEEQVKTLKVQVVKYLLEFPFIDTAGGHLYAMGAKINNPTADRMLEVGKGVMTLIDNIMENELYIYTNQDPIKILQS